ncbi:MAG: SurA N-terminal domain-containing protein [Bryobacterales bacterium]
MRRSIPALALLLVGMAHAEILDRTVAIVGANPITASEVEMQALLEAMFNNTPPDLSEAGRRRALERLVEQRLIEEDITLAGLQVVEEKDLQDAFSQLRQARFGNLGFAQALRDYGLTETNVRNFLRKQLQFTRYVQFRFRAGLQADEDALRAAYRKKYERVASPPPFETVAEELELDLLDKRAETMLDDRVRQLRAETRIVFLDPIRPSTEPAP